MKYTQNWIKWAFVSEIPSINNEEKVLIALGQGKKTVSILSNEFCEEQAFPYLLPKGKFGCKAPRDIPITPAWYFNQRLLNCCIWACIKIVYEQHHLRSSINFDMHKCKPGTLTAEKVQSDFKGTVEWFVVMDNAFSFMNSVKGTPPYWK